MNQTPNSTWDIGTIYKQSWHLTKNNPTLWILGLSVAVLAASGSGRSSNSSSSSRKSPSASPTPSSSNPASVNNTSLPLSLNQLTGGEEKDELSAAMKEFGYRLNSNVGVSLKKVSSATYIFAGVEFFAVILLMSIVSIAASAWARASLMYGCAQADAATKVSLAESAREGRQAVKTFLAIDYLPWFRIMMYGLFAAIIALVGALTQLLLIIPFIFIVYAVVAVIMAIRIILAQIWAYRIAVITHKSYHEAMVAGRLISQGNAGKMILLGIVNSLLDFVTGMVLLLPFGGAALFAIIAAMMNPSPLMFVTAGVTVLISFIIASPLFLAKATVFRAFAYSTWHLSFKIFNNHLPVTHETNL